MRTIDFLAERRRRDPNKAAEAELRLLVLQMKELDRAVARLECAVDRNGSALERLARALCLTWRKRPVP